MKLLPKLPKLNINGDTIVEVLISMAILSLVLGTAYVTSNRSLQLSTEAGNRNQALGYAQKQIEFIKNAALANPTQFAQYTGNPTEDFCIDSQGNRQELDSDACKSGGEFGQFAMDINYNVGTRLFSVKSTWEGSTGTQQQLTLYYRPQGIFQPLQVITGRYEPKPPIQVGKFFETNLYGNVTAGGQPVAKCYFEVEKAGVYDARGWDPTDPSFRNPPPNCNGALPPSDAIKLEVSTHLDKIEVATKLVYRACADNSRGKVCGETKLINDVPDHLSPVVTLCVNSTDPCSKEASITRGKGTSVTLNWKVLFSTSCQATSSISDPTWDGPKTATPDDVWFSDSDVTPQPPADADVRYTIDCQNGRDEHAVDNVTVIVRSVVPPPPPGGGECGGTPVGPSDPPPGRAEACIRAFTFLQWEDQGRATFGYWGSHCYDGATINGGGVPWDGTPSDNDQYRIITLSFNNDGGTATFICAGNRSKSASVNVPPGPHPPTCTPCPFGYLGCVETGCSPNPCPKPPCDEALLRPFSRHFGLFF